MCEFCLRVVDGREHLVFGHIHSRPFKVCETLKESLWSIFQVNFSLHTNHPRDSLAILSLWLLSWRRAVAALQLWLFVPTALAVPERFARALSQRATVTDEGSSPGANASRFASALIQIMRLNLKYQNLTFATVEW